MTKLPDVWNEMSQAEKAELWSALQDEQVEAERSYSRRDKRVYCHRCGRLIRNGSVSFFEGYHIDSCF